MEFVADRFVVTDRGRAVDLATGDVVVLTMASAGEYSERLRWLARCDLFQRLRHPALAVLVDYGPVGESQRFEAWRSSGPWRGAAADAEAATQSAASFLRACGLTIGRDGLRDVQRAGARPVVTPAADAGYPSASRAAGASGVFPLEYAGILCIARRAVPAVAELFDEPCGEGGRSRHDRAPHVVGIWGPDGSGKTTVVHDLARAARLKGYVPITVGLLDTPLGEAINGRSVLLIDDEVPARRRAESRHGGLLDAAIRSPRPHVLVRTSREDTRGLSSVGLARLSAATLVAAILPAHARADPRVRRAAERADGIPGRFVRLIRGTRYEPDRPPASAAPRAAERAAVYGVDGAPDVGGSRTALEAAPAAWPVPSELSDLRQRIHVALQHLEAGRHAPGERGLRQAIGGLVRRGDWVGAGEASLALGASLLRRGRARDAKTTLDTAQEYCRRTASDEASTAVATLAGVAWVDLGRLEEAESVLGAAVASVRGAQNPAAGVAAALALARCRFWRGQYAEADATLEAYAGASLTGPAAVRLRAMQARISVGRLDLARAIATSADAVQRAELLADPALVAEAACASAFAHLAVDDLAALQRDVAACVAAAKASRDPLRAFRARLMLAEELRRAGRRADALDVTATLKRLVVRLPPLLRHRHGLVRDLLSGVEPASDTIARHVAAAGLPALALFVPREETANAYRTVVDDTVELFRVCQSAQEESAALTAVCEQVRRRLHMAAVVFFGIERGSYVRLAGTGTRLDQATAERAAAAGMPIAPHQIEERIEAAVPVRYGGTILGAIAGRWMLGRPPEASRAVSVLTMAATAAAPLMSSLLGARLRPPAGSAGDLLGVSAAMAEVRAAAERAASAPFAVLIEGESGSGKELVARAVHRGGGRRDRPFCTLNCAAMPDDLLESELFGHARGAFTGAVAERVGVFEEAHSGTLLLDEVGELSPRAQAKLLRVIQEGELRRLGENVSRRIDVRIVSATNRDLRREVVAGRFRLDLLYRLDVVRIAVPALRDRREDIPLLVEHFWREATGRFGSRATLSDATVAVLARYEWPGNVREVQNVLAALVVRVGKRGVVPPEALPGQFDESAARPSCRLDDARRTFEERFVRAALVRTGGRRTQAAADLGITRQGLTKLMIRLGIVVE